MRVVVVVVVMEPVREGPLIQDESNGLCGSDTEAATLDEFPCTSEVVVVVVVGGG